MPALQLPPPPHAHVATMSMPPPTTPSLHHCQQLRDLLCVPPPDLGLGFKFNAKGTIDCYEAEMQLLPVDARRREIAFNMIDDDFKVFEGKWSVQEVDGGGILADQEFQTTISYVVEMEPKLWVPVRLLGGKICNDIKTNLVSIREEAQRIQRLQDEVIDTRGFAQLLFHGCPRKKFPFSHLLLQAIVK
ncbi:hypothetical protein ABZP36_033909 [Zizania latifolia]